MLTQNGLPWNLKVSYETFWKLKISMTKRRQIMTHSLSLSLSLSLYIYIYIYIYIYKCGVTEETSAHILCECEALASLRHAHLVSFFLEPKDIQSISLGAIWSFSNASGLPWLDMGHKGPVYKGLGASGPRGPESLTNSYSYSNYTM